MYAIKNTGNPVYDSTGTAIAGNIGVTAISTEAVDKSTWNIVASEPEVQNDDHNMTFSLGNHALTAATSTVYTDYKTVDTANSQFVKVDDNDHTNNTLVPIEPKKDGLKPIITSKIKSTSRSTGTGKTVGVVKVKYQFAALDVHNKPITANTYVGDNRTDAGYEK